MGFREEEVRKMVREKIKLVIKENTMFRRDFIKWLGGLSIASGFGGKVIASPILETPEKVRLDVGNIPQKLDGIFNNLPGFVDIIRYDPTEKGQNPNFFHYKEKGVALPMVEYAIKVDCLSKNRERESIRVEQMVRAGFASKIKDDLFHLLMISGNDRNMVIYDADAPASYLTKRLISLMKIVHRRNCGRNNYGELISYKKGKLTDLVVSPKMFKDFTDEFDIGENPLQDGRNDKLCVFGVNIHPINEMGYGHSYDTYYHGELRATLANDDQELVIGVDSSFNNVAIAIPIGYEPTGVWEPRSSWCEENKCYRDSYTIRGRVGTGVLSGDTVLLGSC